MPFCPECRYEYIAGTEECPDCGAKLVDKLPPDPKELEREDEQRVEELRREHNEHLDESPLVCVFDQENDQQGELVRYALASNGIRCWSSAGRLAGGEYGSIYVLQDHLEEAQKVVASLNLGKSGGK